MNYKQMLLTIRDKTNEREKKCFSLKYGRNLILLVLYRGATCVSRLYILTFAFFHVSFLSQYFLFLQKTATAVAYCKRGRGLLRVNGRPLDQIEPKVLQYKLQEPLLLLGKEKFAGVDIRIRVSGGGHVAQVYAIRQAISKALVSYYQKCE